MAPPAKASKATTSTPAATPATATATATASAPAAPKTAAAAPVNAPVAATPAAPKTAAAAAPAPAPVTAPVTATPVAAKGVAAPAPAPASGTPALTTTSSAVAAALASNSGPSVADGTVQSCINLEQWNKKLEEATAQNRLMVVGFKAKWCGPCKLIAPIFVELAKKNPTVLFVKVDVDELMEVATQWNVQGMPTFLMIKDAKELERVVGANKDELEKRVTWHGKNSQTS